MEIQKELKNNFLPTKIINQERKNRFAKIFFNMSITCAILILCALLSLIIAPVFYMFAIVLLFGAIVVIVVFSIGTVFVVGENIVTKLWEILTLIINSGDKMGIIASYSFIISKWLSVAGIVISAIGIVFWAINKKDGRVAKIITLSIMLAIFIVVLIFNLVTGGVK